MYFFFMEFLKYSVGEENISNRLCLSDILNIVCNLADAKIMINKDICKYFGELFG